MSPLPAGPGPAVTKTFHIRATHLISNRHRVRHLLLLLSPLGLYASGALLTGEN